jgi:hypothetical protein
MGRVDFDQWEGKEVTRVYIAGRLAEARDVEKTLTDHGIDYAVDLEPFRLMVLGIFPSEHTGVGFYVLSGQAHFSKRALLDAGLRDGMEEDEPSE